MKSVLKVFKQSLSSQHIKTLNNKGMTLLEIMIVLVILGSLAGVLAVQVNNRLKAAKVNQAKIMIGELSKALDMYYTDCGSYPSSDSGLQALVEAPADCSNWIEPYVKKINKDPWNRELIYENTGNSFVLKSLGSDGREDGSGDAKDISSED